MFLRQLKYVPAVLFLVAAHVAIGQNTAGVQKTSAYLTQLTREGNEQDSVTVTLSFTKYPLRFTPAARVLFTYPSAGMVVARTSLRSLKILLQNDSLLFADAWRSAKEELTTGAPDLSANRVTTMQHRFPAFNGSSVNASIKEQKWDSTDIDLRGRYFNSGVAALTASSHATFMATLVAGAGNSSPYAKGAAPAARLTSSSFASLFPDGDDVYRNHSISVQNHSYGTDIENYYGNEAAAYDMSVASNPALVQVFSAGNRGTSTPSSGAYADVEGFANLTGNFKMAKNIITVGHIDSTYSVLPLSSKGPAYDGRVKPELVAFGEDGSSGAAALVSGTAIVLQDAFRKATGNLPPASLVKAVLLNSAQDVSAPGPDFLSGYGNLDAAAAAQTIAQKDYFQDTLTDVATRRFRITVPPSTARVQLTLVWTDPAAAPNAPRSLVNNLDAVLKFEPTGSAWLPWVLNASAQKDSLLKVPVRGKDSLNNVEQISLANPQPGAYSIEVSASGLQGSQPFSIAYLIERANTFTWTYPTGSDVLLAGKQNILRWNATLAGTAPLEYSLDGQLWKSIANVSLATEYHKWIAPDSVSTALLRMRVPNATAVVSDTFVLSHVTELTVGYNCTDSALLLWNGDHVSGYTVYGVRDKYLEPVYATGDTSYSINKAATDVREYSVAPRIGNKPGLRSFTIDYTVAGVQCFIKSFYASLTSNHSAAVTLTLGTVTGIREVRIQKWVDGRFTTLPLPGPGLSSTMVFNDPSLLKGVNQYRAEISLANGKAIYSEIVQVVFLGDAPVLLFPNPSHQGMPVKILAQAAGIYSLQVLDANGRTVFRQALNSLGVYTLPLQLPAGLYYFVVREKNGISAIHKLTVL